MKVRVPYFDGIELNCTDEYLDDKISQTDPILVEFLKRDTNDRLKDSRHVFNYYRDVYQQVGGEEDDAIREMGIVSDPEQIWMHVTPKDFYIGKGSFTDTSHFIVLEADCAWEEEHGLLMSWKDGKTLCKVSQYDGHATNNSASANHNHTNTVYRSTCGKLDTTLDG